MTVLPSSQAVAFQVGDAIGFAWRRTWRNFWRLLLLSIVFSILTGIASAFSFSGAAVEVDPSAIDPEAVMDALTQSSGGVMSIVGSVVQFLVSAFLGLGLIRVALGVMAGERVRLGRVFSFRGYGRYLLGSIVVGILAGLGFVVPFGIGLAISAATDWVVLAVLGAVAGIVLAIVLALGLSLFGYAIVDKDMHAVDALRASWAIVRPRFGSLLGLEILLAIIAVGIVIAAFVLGALMLVIGLLVTLPVAGVIVFGMGALSMAYAYRTLSGEPVI